MNMYARNNMYVNLLLNFYFAMVLTPMIRPQRQLGGPQEGAGKALMPWTASEALNPLVLWQPHFTSFMEEYIYLGVYCNSQWLNTSWGLK